MPYRLYVFPIGKIVKIINNKITIVIDSFFIFATFETGISFFSVPKGAKKQKGIN